MSLIPICFLVDANVSMYLKMVCLSILKYIKYDYHFCVLTDTEHSKYSIEELFKTFCDQSHFTVKSLKSEDAVFLESIYISEQRGDIKSLNLAQCIIYRYFDYDKLLFMEPDQIVKKDLTVFWNQVISEKNKIREVSYQNGAKTLITLEKLNPGKPVYAYNCGVMVIDTKFWKEKNCEMLCMDAIKKQKEMNGEYYNYYAEGAINVALQPWITHLDEKYNTCNLGWLPQIDSKILENAVILHWNGPMKPWKLDGYYKEYYLI